MTRNRLLHHFSPMLLRIIDIAESVAVDRDRNGARPPSSQEAERNLLAVLEQCRATARHQSGRGPTDKPDDKVEDAAYATVAFADDLFPHRRFNNWWRGEPMQLRLFDQRVAGDRFFERARQLTEAHPDLSEIYLIAIGLGFRGRYHDEHPRDELDRVRRALDDVVVRLSANLSPAAVPARSFSEEVGDFLLPQPYMITQPNRSIIPKSFPWLLVGSLLAVAAMVGLGIAAYLLWPRPPVQETAQAILSGLACSKIEVLSDDGRGVLKLNGRQGDQAGFEERLSKLKGLSGVKEVDAKDVRSVAKPFCDVLDVVDAHSLFPVGLKLLPSQADGRYDIGRDFTLKVETGQDFPGFLSVFYVQPDSVAALLPSAVNPDPKVQPRDVVQIGRPRAEWTSKISGWQIDGPTGMHVVIGLVTRQPLWDKAAAVMPVGEFIGKLKDVLSTQPALTDGGSKTQALAGVSYLDIRPAAP